MTATPTIGSSMNIQYGKLLLAVLLVILVLPPVVADEPTASPSTEESPVGEHKSKAKKMIVALGGSTDECIGCNWPNDTPNGASNQIGIETPMNVSIRYGQNKSLTTYSKVTFVGEKDGFVRRVTISPLANLVKFQEAVKSVRDFGGNLNIDSDESLEVKLQELEKKSPSNDPFGTETFKQVVDGSIEMFVEIKPHVSGDGWFVNISLMDLSRYDTE